MAQELIRMNLTIPADTSDTSAGVVAFIPLQQFQNLLGALRVFFEQPQINIGPIGMVIDG